MLLHIKVPKSGHVYTIDTTKLPEVSNQYLFEYGATQSLVDATASMIRKDFVGTDAEFAAESKKKSDARFAQIQTGTVPGSRATIDPIAVIAAQLGKTVDEVRTMLGMVAAETAVESATTLIPADKKRKAG